LSQQIQQIHQSSRGTYGSPRIHASLGAKGFQVGRQRVVRLMAKLGICARAKRKFKATTDSVHRFPIAQNRLERNFTTSDLVQAWVSDITYIRLQQEFGYLAVLMDVFTRSIRGWHLARSLDQSLTPG